MTPRTIYIFVYTTYERGKRSNPCLADLGKVLEVSLREDSVVEDVQAGPLPVGHGGAEEATVPVLSRVEHDAHRASSGIVGVLHQLA